MRTDAYVMTNSPDSSGVVNVGADDVFVCDVCKKSFPMYGTINSIDKEVDVKVCIGCTGKMFEALLKQLPVGGKIVLYITGKDGVYHASDWSGGFKTRMYGVTHSTNNFGAHVMCGRFAVGDAIYTARNIGGNDILHCKRIKGESLKLRSNESLLNLYVGAIKQHVSAQNYLEVEAERIAVRNEIARRMNGNDDEELLAASVEVITRIMQLLAKLPDTIPHQIDLSDRCHAIVNMYNNRKESR